MVFGFSRLGKGKFWPCGGGKIEDIGGPLSFFCGGVSAWGIVFGVYSDDSEDVGDADGGLFTGDMSLNILFWNVFTSYLVMAIISSCFRQSLACWI